MFLLDYPDASLIDSYADEAMHWVVMNGIVTGRTEKNGTYLRPSGSATRAEAASMLQRFLELK